MKPTACVLLVAAVLLASARPRAHEIPSDVRIQAFLQPEGQRLRLLVRLPVASTVNDVEWPMKGPMLDLGQVRADVLEAGARWIANRVDLYESDRKLGAPVVAAARVSLPSDTSFDSYERAFAHATDAPLAADVEVPTSQALLDVLLEYPIASTGARFSIDTRFEAAGLRSVTVLRFRAAAVERAFQFHGNSGFVRLDPRWFQAASRFVVDGFFHILGGVDHLLFLLCLVIPFRRFGALVVIVTSFTVAHSVTLIASAYDMAPSAAWFPPLVETVIAASIVYMALENIVATGPGGPEGLPVRSAVIRRWMVTFGFGLVHGFGFSFALRDSLQLAGSHVLTSLLSFNVGVELGQLLVLVTAVPALNALFRFAVPERLGTIVLSAIVAHTGWHWMTERGSRLAQYTFEWPVLDLALFDLLLRWSMLAVGLAGVAWLIFGVFAKGTLSASPKLRAKAGEPSPTYTEGSAL